MSGDIDEDYEDDEVTLSDEDFDDDIGVDEEEGDEFSKLSSRSLSIRRAIEERMEQKQMDEAFNYLDLDDEEDFEDE